MACFLLLLLLLHQTRPVGVVLDLFLVQKIIEQSYQSHARVVDQLWRKTELGKTQLAEQVSVVCVCGGGGGG